MREIPIASPESLSLRATARIVEAAAKRQGLSVSMKDTLKSYPDCIHWHFVTPGSKGTLEVTLWEGTPRLWISVQDGRKAEWIDKAIPPLKASLESELRKKAK
jgi:hypothetical protein